MAEDVSLPTEARTGPAASPLNLLRLVRVAVTGVLMGTANLIPGVSGGTMILAMGLYQEFIDSVAEVTALRFSWRRLVFLVVLIAFALGSIVGLAGAILYLLFHHPVAMFALFMGLTLGGVPLLLREVRPLRLDVWIATLAGFALMVGVFLYKGGGGFPHNAGMDFVSGVVGSTTMVLPGISGSYMLLVMDQYERVVGSVHDFKQTLAAHDNAGLKSAVAIIIPVGIGAVLGIVGLSNLLKVLLRRWHRVTIGVLLGILLGSVIGLWPFGKQPSDKSLQRRSVPELKKFASEHHIPLTVELDAREDLIAAILSGWDQRGSPTYTPKAVTLAAALVIVGFALTCCLSRMRATPTSTGKHPPTPPGAGPGAINVSVAVDVNITRSQGVNGGGSEAEA